MCRFPIRRKTTRESNVQRHHHHSSSREEVQLNKYPSFSSASSSSCLLLGKSNNSRGSGGKPISEKRTKSTVVGAINYVQETNNNDYCFNLSQSVEELLGQGSWSVVRGPDEPIDWETRGETIQFICNRFCIFHSREINALAPTICRRAR